jgi:hypothetical protein
MSLGERAILTITPLVFFPFFPCDTCQTLLTHCLSKVTTVTVTGTSQSWSNSQPTTVFNTYTLIESTPSISVSWTTLT